MQLTHCLLYDSSDSQNCITLNCEIVFNDRTTKRQGVTFTADRIQNGHLHPSSILVCWPEVRKFAMNSCPLFPALLSPSYPLTYSPPTTQPLKHSTNNQSSTQPPNTEPLKHSTTQALNHQPLNHSNTQALNQQTLNHKTLNHQPLKHSTSQTMNHQSLNHQPLKH